eukprot:2514958-Pleurochrysis_carterae.AAC.2
MASDWSSAQPKSMPRKAKCSSAGGDVAEGRMRNDERFEPSECCPFGLSTSSSDCCGAATRERGNDTRDRRPRGRGREQPVGEKGVCGLSPSVNSLLSA